MAPDTGCKRRLLRRFRDTEVDTVKTEMLLNQRSCGIPVFSEVDTAKVGKVSLVSIKKRGGYRYGYRLKLIAARVRGLKYP